MLNKNNLLKLNNFMSRKQKEFIKMAGGNNWRLKWFQVSLKRCILDGRQEKP